MTSKDIYSRYWLINFLGSISGLDQFHSRNEKSHITLKKIFPLVLKIVINLWLISNILYDIRKWYLSSVPFVAILPLVGEITTNVILFSVSYRHITRISYVLSSFFDMDNQYRLYTKKSTRSIFCYTLNTLDIVSMYGFCLLQTVIYETKFVNMRVLSYRCIEHSMYYIYTLRFIFLLSEIYDRSAYATSFFREFASPKVYIDDDSLEILSTYVDKLKKVYILLREQHTAGISILIANNCIKVLKNAFFLTLEWKSRKSEIEWFSNHSCYLYSVPSVFFRNLIIIETASSSQMKVKF